MGELKHYILFPSYNSGLLLESKLKKEKIKYTIVPSPRKLTACCGIAITYNKEDEDRIKEIINEYSIEIQGFYSLETNYRNFYSNE